MAITAKPINSAKTLLILGLAVLLCGEGFLGYRLHTLSEQQEQIKADYSDVNNITLGLLSVEQWRDKVSGIINHQVRHLTLTPRQKKQLQTEVEQILMALVNKAEAIINKPQKSIGSKLKKLVVKTFVKSDKIKAKVPEYARAIIAKADNPESKAQLSNMAMSKFNQVRHSGSMDSTQDANQALKTKLFKRYSVTSPEQLNQKLEGLLVHIRTQMYQYCGGMLACILAVLALWWAFRKRTELHGALFIMSLLFAFILLGIGLTASMIEVDARIRSLDFVLLGQHAHFDNQVLFYQSKSILDVVEVLIKQPAIDSILVGILILVFSILFPLMKLSSTGIHLLSKRKLAENRIIKYFAFQSGKWSMADVIVIGTLMAYIGLNGLLQNQLDELNIKNEHLTLLTTNNTALQPGYIIFISFVIYGLILSTILKAITPYDTH